MNSSARAEQETTRQELQQVLHAMVHIEQHLKRRDQELQELLKILNRTYDIVERRAIKERSSVVIIAICVLMTSYES
jgi:hypothetical protein